MKYEETNIEGVLRRTSHPVKRPSGLHEIAKAHWDWVESMGWHNKNELESLALIASEVGEAVNECRGEKPTKNFGEELADIILRTIDLAHDSGIDIESKVWNKIEKNREKGNYKNRRI